MNTTQSTSHRPFLHGYYVLPCCSSRHCGYSTPRRVTRQPSFTIESILSRRASSPPRRPTADSVDYLRTQGAASSLSASLSTLQRLHPYPACYSRALGSTIDTKGECSSTTVKRPWKAEKPKRVRTIFSPDQLERLEKEFDNQQYIVGTERFYLASELGLTETQVKVWFQNRRIKWRKQNLEGPKAKEEDEEEEPEQI